MKKETITKDDGRLLTYYWFDQDTDSAADETAKADNSSLTDQSESPA